jgi:hypothetical protein
MESFEKFKSRFNNKIEKEIIDDKPIEKITESVTVEDELKETPIIESVETKIEPKIVEESKVVEPISGYRVYRDRAETFICDMEITGANTYNSKARVIIESTGMTYMFEGTIDGKGHCEIPLKKMNFLNENEIGKIKLEVIADDMIFSPWEDTFVAVNHRKVTVKVTESIDTTPKIGVRISNIR